MSEVAAPVQGGVFKPAVAIGLVLAGFVAFLAVVGLGTYEADFRNDMTGGAHALSKSAVGYAGLVDLLNASGRPAVVARGDVGAGNDDGMLILTIDDGDPTQDLLDLATVRRFNGPVLAVLPKWSVAPIARLGWVSRIGLRRNVDADTWLGPTPPDVDRLIDVQRASGTATHTLFLLEDGVPVGQIATGPIDSFQTFKDTPGYTPVVVDENGDTVLATAYAGIETSPNRVFFVLSEPDLLNNQGIAELANASAASALLNEIHPNGPVFFDVTLNGFERSRSLLKMMTQPPFLAATLCALAATAAMLWAAFGRFGAARRPERDLALGKRALADNQAGLMRMAGREHRMGGRYAATVAGLVARATGAPRELSGEALDAFLDRMSRGGGAQETFTEIRWAAQRAKDKTQLMDAAQRLHRWRLEMTRETD